ncbi:uncharacterized protein BX664DRAFT_354686 [Halteromyces radiatus]|uniref:uncharacterized protein n=1 Tax=Halteromyces radiatus TaxID=101107 RepID=UPI00221EB72F|nr:uncharacterized protein BX664DRAFT_354686 [Halteromyces radiatus]KAI8099226.1 hypothetical protein BX664DRAFT_354686 [Halteromyces radiatus]
MNTTYTSIILDGHVTSYAQTIQQPDNNNNIDPSQNLPSFPIWTVMVDSTLNFCRLTWDLYEEAKISVMIAGNTSYFLNDWNNPRNQLSKISRGFEQYQAQNTSNSNRIQTALEKSFGNMFTNFDLSSDTHNGRIILILTCKGLDEYGIGFRDDVQTDLADLRSTISEAYRRHRIPEFSGHIHIDVIRILPYDSTISGFPVDIQNEMIHDVTLSVYNVPNGQQHLKRSLIYLAQEYFNINCLRIKNQMSPEMSIDNMEIAEYYYAAENKQSSDLAKTKSDIRIFEDSSMDHRTEQVFVVDTDQDELQGHEDWCISIHPVTIANLTDTYSNRLLNDMMNGSRLYLSTESKMQSDAKMKNKIWDKVLLFYEGNLVLEYIGHEFEHQFTNLKIEHSIKKEFSSSNMIRHNQVLKSTEFMDALLKPNLFNDIPSLLKYERTNPSCTLIEYNAQLYSQNTQPKVTKTSKSLERASKWRTCLRDGYEYPDINNDDALNLDSLHLQNNIHVSSGFGIAFGLISDLFDQLESAMIGDVIENIPSVESLIDMMITELFAAKMNGSKNNLFSKSIGKQQSRILATRLLVSLYLIADRFKNDSQSHLKVCQRILKDIAQHNSEEDKKRANKEAPGMPRHEETDMAWDQVKRYESMTYREKEDVIETDFNNVMGKEAAKIPPSAGINPMFRGRRHTPEVGEKPKRYPDPSIAIPYLPVIGPTMEEIKSDEENAKLRYGSPETLLGQFWMAEKYKRKVKEFDGRKPLTGDEEQGEIE